ncbi:MAG: hypothetical protein M1832_002565 [Thelocarpon impressellum]|nr:MAG: hypothetical protein M1832_002565 [Thelocarpon impressellum]
MPPRRGPSPGGMKRGREYSPPGRGARSPPPAKRERLASPQADYDRPRSLPRRPYSPPRDGRRSPPTGPRGGWRPRSRSPPRREEPFQARAAAPRRQRSPSPGPRGYRPDHPSEPSSGRESVTTSRRNSPPIHPSRMALQNPQMAQMGESRAPGRMPVSPPPRSPYGDAEPASRRPYSPRDRSPPRGPSGYRSPRRQEYAPTHREEDYVDAWKGPPSGPGHRNGNGNGNGGYGGRRSPDASSRGFDRQSTMTPPAGPSASHMSMSAHSRGGHHASVLAAPTHPRGGPPPRREGSYGGPPGGGSRRGGGPPPSHYPSPIHTRGPPAFSTASPTAPSPGGGPGGVPTGPRSVHAPSPHPAFPSPAFRGSNNSTSRTYPLTQRFHPALKDLSSHAQGGRPPLASASSVDRKLAKLQQEKEKLEAELDRKLARKREAMRTWDKLERESGRDALKSELAEQQSREMAGEGGGGSGGGAAF